MFHFLDPFLYQPFYNLLILFYTLMERIPGLKPDMGLAVVFLTIVIRILMLPLSIASTRSREERHQIQETVRRIRESSVSPDIAKQKAKSVLGSNRRVVISEAINFFIQMAIFFVLYRIFTTGLEGEDLNLVYEKMPPFHFPFNLIFLDKFDLAHPSFFLNLFQSCTILIVEVMSMIDSPYPHTRGDFVRYIIILPVVSFVLFAGLPAGKKLFVITTLWFSFFFLLTNIMIRWFSTIFDKIDGVGMEKLEKAVND